MFDWDRNFGNTNVKKTLMKNLIQEKNTVHKSHRNRKKK